MYYRHVFWFTVYGASLFAIYLIVLLHYLPRFRCSSLQNGVNGWTGNSLSQIKCFKKQFPAHNNVLIWWEHSRDAVASVGGRFLTLIIYKSKGITMHERQQHNLLKGNSIPEQIMTPGIYCKACPRLCRTEGTIVQPCSSWEVFWVDRWMDKWMDQVLA